MRFQLRGLLLAAVVTISAPGVVLGEVSDQMFTVYLARHAEKQPEAKNPEDPSLSACGEMRAGSLAAMLRNVRLDHVYSTPYERTRSTAAPSAQLHQLEVELYDPRQLEEFSGQLLKQKQNALVIGHSNTTSVLAGLISDDPLEPFAEDEYDRLYLVTVSGGNSQVNLLDQNFKCDR